MSEFQLAIIQLHLAGIMLAIIVSSGIIGSAINNLAKAIKEKNKDE